AGPRRRLTLCLFILTCFFFHAILCAVSKDFQDCRRFFYMQCPPGGLEGATLSSICQRYRGHVYYATLYDTGRRLPLYSAYIFQKSDGKRRADAPWMYEPQVRLTADESGDMRALPLSEHTPPFIEDSQAVLEDYTDAIEYKRCPLAPDVHQADPPYLDAVRRRLNNFCLGNAFLVTGVVIAGDSNSPYEVRFMFPSYAGYAPNGRNQQGVVEVTVKALEAFLKSNTDKDVVIFYKNCMT
uniref:Si:dkey-85k7.11 n=1 Tax=Neogobius melanostomus TaxID=47308 RepID=A0A8C6UTC1_9GOBI